MKMRFDMIAGFLTFEKSFKIVNSIAIECGITFDQHCCNYCGHFWVKETLEGKCSICSTGTAIPYRGFNEHHGIF